MFSFSKNKKTIELSPYIRRICDLTTPNMTSSPELLRVENRYNRAIPTLLCPWVSGRPILDSGIIGVTKDIADHGVGLILTQEFHAEEVLLGFWVSHAEMEEPWFFVGTPRRCCAVGGGFWTLGVELREFATENHAREVAPLRKIAEKLLPPCEPVTV